MFGLLPKCYPIEKVRRDALVFGNGLVEGPNHQDPINTSASVAMLTPLTSLEDATEAVVQFQDERDWSQYRTPRHLASAITIEASELQEELLWRDPDEVEERLMSDESREGVKDEIGDVLICALLFCDRVGIDPLAAIAEKMKYTSEELAGSSTLAEG